MVGGGLKMEMVSRHAGWMDVVMREGDPCPDCGNNGLMVLNSFRLVCELCDGEFRRKV